jgi:colanic acid/amylovoran biosynthesis glycosyltransferase
VRPHIGEGLGCSRSTQRGHAIVWLISVQPDDRPLLVVVPNIGIAIDGDRLFMDIKATEGSACYAQFWPGRVRCLGRRTEPTSISYGRWYTRAELPFEVTVLSPNADGTEIAEQARDAAVLMAGADHHLDLGVVEAMGAIPVVMIIEYTLRTRLDITRVSDAPLLKRLWTAIWLLRTERTRRKVLAAAAGIQANGWPAFSTYGRRNKASLLYFDTRLRSADLMGAEAASAKAAALQTRAPLRLAFSGRLERMKGADHLIPIARLLREQGCAFSLDIYGDGSLRRPMMKAVDEAGLNGSVRIHGPVDYETVLVPEFKASVDLFLCCHPQGDPSCTYLETLGCGVPILGYRNEAWLGVLGLGPCGREVRIGDDVAMAREVIRLDRDRAELGRLTRGAVAVAESRSFEKVYAQRIDHLWSIASGGASRLHSASNPERGRATC